MLRRLKIAARLARLKLIFDIGGRTEDTLFVAASGRSGSTWLLELLTGRGVRRVWEPLHPNEVKGAEVFRDRKYMSAEQSFGVEGEFFDRILRGKVKGPWIDSRNRYRIECVYRARTVKCIRANLLLEWLHQHWPEIPVILLVRHPCAVAASRLKLKWNSYLAELLSQQELVADRLRPFRDLLCKAKTGFQQHICEWCVENVVPLTAKDADRWLHVVYYEDLCRDPVNVLARLAAATGWESRTAYELALKRKHADSPKARPRARCRSSRGWQDEVSKHDVEYALHAMKSCGLDHIYGAHEYPLVSGSGNTWLAQNRPGG